MHSMFTMNFIHNFLTMFRQLLRPSSGWYYKNTKVKCGQTCRRHSVAIKNYDNFSQNYISNQNKKNNKCQLRLSYMFRPLQAVYL